MYIITIFTNKAAFDRDHLNQLVVPESDEGPGPWDRCLLYPTGNTAFIFIIKTDYITSHTLDNVYPVFFIYSRYNMSVSFRVTKKYNL